MAYKIAVASSDGKMINQHFGRSRQFLIFEIEENQGYRFLELRQNSPACHSGEHGQGSMQDTVDLLADCKIVLVSRIGRGAIEALSGRGIRAYIAPDFIEEALKALVGNEEDFPSRYERSPH